MKLLSINFQHQTSTHHVIAGQLKFLELMVQDSPSHVGFLATCQIKCFLYFYTDSVLQIPTEHA